jgi:hypothetical protein
MASTQETPLIRFEKTCLKRGDARRSPWRLKRRW